MYLLDTNIIIYSVLEKFDYLDSFLSHKPKSAVSIITKIEVLGFKGITESDKNIFEAIFNILPVIPLTDNIANVSVKLKQQRKIKLGDAIIAATALTNGLTLITNNVSDFKNFEGLHIINPIK